MDNQGTELIVVEKLVPATLFFEGGLTEIMDGIRAKLDEFEGDVSTDAGRKEIVSMAYKVSRSKSLLDAMRKDLISDAKAKIDKANGAWKPAKETLDQWRDEVRQPVTDWEAEEKRKDEERAAAIQARLDELRLLSTDPLKLTASDLKSVISQIEAFEITPDVFFDQTPEANRQKQEKLIAACEALETRERLDREEAERKAENERLAKVKAEQDKIAAEQAAAQAKIDEANRKIQEEKDALKAEQEKAERQKEREEFERQAKIKAEANAKAAAEQAEKDRVEKEKADAAEKARQEALKPDREKLEAFAQFLVDGISFPDVGSIKAKGILHYAKNALGDLSNWIYDEAQRL